MITPEQKSTFNQKQLKMPGLKPSDYYLYDQERKYFHFNMRELFVLGLRMIYATQHGQITREQMMQLAAEIAGEDLDYEDRDSRPTYKEFSTISSS